MDDRSKKKYERLARAMSSDSVMYMKDAILKSFEEDNFFEAIEENLEENKKAFLSRTNEEAASTNILAVATLDVIVYPLGTQGKYPIF